MTVSKITSLTRNAFLIGKNAPIAMPTKESMNQPNFVVVKAQSMKKLFKFQQLQMNGKIGLTMTKNFETTFANTTTVVLWHHWDLILRRECQVLIQL